MDTNIFVYAANADSPFHDRCSSWLENQRRRPDVWFASWPIFYEFLRLVTHPRTYRKPWSAGRAWQFVGGLMSSPGFSLLVPTLRHAEVAGEVLAEIPQLSGNIFHDAHTAILMREHGIKTIVTRDADFRRFAFLEVIDPASL